MRVPTSKLWRSDIAGPLSASSLAGINGVIFLILSEWIPNNLLISTKRLSTRIAASSITP